MSEREVTIEQVRKEHLKEVKIGPHWAYLIGVLVGGLILMLLLIAWLGS
jgi:hypothetical protein